MASVSILRLRGGWLRRLFVLTASLIAVAGVSLVAWNTAAIGTTNPPSTITLSMSPASTGAVDDGLQIIAFLAPQAAYGTVTLTDNGVVLASAPDYRIEWSWSASSMAVGVHHLTVTFQPASGYAPSTATATYTVPGEVEAGTATPKPTPTIRDTQPISVTIPNGGTGPTKTTAPPTTKSVQPTPPHTSSPPSGTAPNGTDKSPGGSNLPSTGFDALLATAVAMVLLAAGTSMVGAARRKRRAG